MIITLGFVSISKYMKLYHTYHISRPIYHESATTMFL